MRRTSLVALVIAAVGIVPLLALAQSTSPPDLNDTDGVLDASEVRFSAGSRPRWKTLTFERWTAASIWDRGYVLIQLDTFGTARSDYYVLVRSDGYRMLGDLFRDRKRKNDYSVGSVSVWRADKSSVSVRFPLSKMRIGGTRIFYRWLVKTLFIGKGCARVCIDRVPDEGSVQTLLPGAEPSPTPTPTALPSETPTDTPSPEATPTP